MGIKMAGVARLRWLCALASFSAVVLFGFQAMAADAPAKVCSAKICFDVEVMSTPEDRERGLMYRDGLSPNQGMLFIFEESSRYPFWMKNMRFAIDICWLDDTKKIIDVKSGIPPCTAEPCDIYTPKSNARYVLELPSGAAEASGFRSGTVLKFLPG